MTDIPKNSQRKVRNQNPITSDPALTQLLEESKSIKNDEQFKGWKDEFLESYKQFLDPAGVQNAKMSDVRLLKSMEKLAGKVVAVKKLVDEGKISAESQSVMGKRALTNMTDQMAASEQEIARFMPMTGADEEKVGYDKFELGAVMIEDGFHVYEHLKATKDIINDLQENVLSDALPSHQKSIIQFYARQVQSFCDVMADIGLFRLMEDIVEMYKIVPRNKTQEPQTEVLAPETPEKSMPPAKPVQKPKRDPDKGLAEIQLDPNKKYNIHTEYNNGYFDPFSGTAPGPEKVKDPEQDEDGEENEGDGEEDDYMIFFDMKTGSIGKVPRKECISRNFVITQNEQGGEDIQGEIEDDDEKEKLIWEIKKALKQKKSNGPKDSKPQGPRYFAATPKKNGSKTMKSPVLSDARRSQSPGRDSAPTRGVGRSRSGDGLVRPESTPARGVERTRSGDGLVRPANAPLKRTSVKKKPPLSTDSLSVEKRNPPETPPTTKPSFQKKESSETSGAAPSSRPSVQSGEPNRAVPTKRTSLQKKDSSQTDSVRKTTPVKRSSVQKKDSTETEPAKKTTPAKRPSVKKVMKDPKPSNDGWSTPTSMAETRRNSQNKK